MQFAGKAPKEYQIVKELSSEYRAEYGRYDKEVWHQIMSSFEDANLYQTWSYDMVRYGRKNVAHMVLKRGDNVVGAAQVRIVRLPCFRSGIAYIRWGPMWRRSRAQEETEVFSQAIRALRNEFSRRRGLLLRLYPLAYKEQHEPLKQILEEEGYKPFKDGKIDRTLIIDLKPSLEELRTNLDQKWRNCLNRGEKNRLELTIGEEGYLFDEVSKIYDQMARRKGLAEANDISYLKRVQKDLPPALKLKVILCRLNGELCSGAIFSGIGTTGVYLRGATSDQGLKTNGSYIVQWTFLKWLKENGFLYYDLNGINREVNPGTYHFKSGMAGKRGREVEFLGRFQVADNILSDLVVKGGENLFSGYRRVRQAVKSFRHSMKKGD